MTNRGWLHLLSSALRLLGLGLLALNFPVFIDAWDQWGWQIKCGTGYSTDLHASRNRHPGRLTRTSSTSAKVR